MKRQWDLASMSELNYAIIRVILVDRWRHEISWRGEFDTRDTYPPCDMMRMRGVRDAHVPPLKHNYNRRTYAVCMYVRWGLVSYQSIMYARRVIGKEHRK